MSVTVDQFFIFFFVDFALIFRCHNQPKDGKNELDSQTQNVMLNLLRKKFISKIKYSRSSPDPDFLGVTISKHVIYFQFFANFQTLVDNSGKPKSVDSKQRN